MLNQKATQKMQHKLLPQQIQLLQLFHLNHLELEQRIQLELSENPMLEEQVSTDGDTAAEETSKETDDFKDWDELAYDDTPSYKTELNQYFSRELPERPLVETGSFRNDLKQQLQFVLSNPADVKLGEYLIDCLNDNGMLEQDLQSIADDYAFKIGEWKDLPEFEAVLEKIQKLDPPGIGARNIQECLLLQLNRMNTKRPDVKIAMQVVKDYFDDLKNRNISRVLDSLSIDQEDFKIILQLLGSLKFKPLAADDNSVFSNERIFPDFILVRENDRLDVALYKERSKSLYINSSWMNTAKGKGTHVDRSTKHYLNSKLNAAQWFVSSLQKREQTLLKVVKAIVHLQKDYFLHGDIKYLKPMVLKNVADICGADLATISRITSNKHIDTSFGIISLKFIFGRNSQ
jgi:RNA polymerase sigma-54 factor